MRKETITLSRLSSFGAPVTISISREDLGKLEELSRHFNLTQSSLVSRILQDADPATVHGDSTEAFMAGFELLMERHKDKIKNEIAGVCLYECSGTGGSFPAVMWQDLSTESKTIWVKRARSLAFESAVTAADIKTTASTGIMQFFKSESLTGLAQITGLNIDALAMDIDSTVPDGPEKSAGLRKLLEAKDCLVRASYPTKENP